MVHRRRFPAIATAVSLVVVVTSCSLPSLDDYDPLPLAQTSFLYAADGERILPTHPPITISLATDRYLRQGGRWLCTYRRFEHLFEGETPVTNPNLDGAQ